MDFASNSAPIQLETKKTQIDPAHPTGVNTVHSHPCPGSDWRHGEQADSNFLLLSAPPVSYEAFYCNHGECVPRWRSFSVQKVRKNAKNTGLLLRIMRLAGIMGRVSGDT